MQVHILQKYKYFMCKVQTFDVQKSTNIICAKLQNAMVKGTYRYKHSIFKSTGTGTNIKHAVCKSTNIRCAKVQLLLVKGQKCEHSMCKNTNMLCAKVQIFLVEK